MFNSAYANSQWYSSSFFKSHLFPGTKNILHMYSGPTCINVVITNDQAVPGWSNAVFIHTCSNYVIIQMMVTCKTWHWNRSSPFSQFWWSKRLLQRHIRSSLWKNSDSFKSNTVTHTNFCFLWRFFFFCQGLTEYIKTMNFCHQCCDEQVCFYLEEAAYFSGMTNYWQLHQRFKCVLDNQSSLKHFFFDQNGIYSSGSQVEQNLKN